MANLNSTIVNGFLRVIGKTRIGSLEVESNDLVDNLNADLLDGKHASDFASAIDFGTLSEQVGTNTGNILKNMQDIQTNKEGIGTNKDDITNLKSRMTTAESGISTNKTDITNLKTKTDTTNTNLSNLTTRVGTAETDISGLKTKTDTTNTNLSNLSSQVSTNATNIQTNANDISGLKTRLSTDESNIANNTQRIDEIMEGTAEIPTVADAEHAGDADKLGGQLPAYYAKTSDLSKYLPLVGGTVTGTSSITKILGASTSTSLGVYGLKGLNSDGSADAPLYLNQGNSQNVYINNTSNLVYHSGNIPSASTSQKGIVQLNNTRTSTSTTEAATANALKSAYDTLNTALTTHSNNTTVHLTDADRIILTKANKFKGYYETETALNNAHPTGEAGDYAIVNSTDTMWIWDADKEGGAGWKDGAGKGSVVSVNNMTGEVVLTKSNIGLGNVDNTSDVNKPVSTAQQAALDKKVNKAGDTMTGNLLINKSSEPNIGVTNGTRRIELMIGSSGVNRGIYDRENLSWLIYKDNISLTTPDIFKTSNTTDSTSTMTGSIIAAGGVAAAKQIRAGTVITAGTDLKTGSGIINFKDKSNIRYNETDECLEFVFI